MKYCCLNYLLLNVHCITFSVKQQQSTTVKMHVFFLLKSQNVGGSWIYNYLCSQCLSLLMLRVQIPLKQGVLDTTLCDKVCQ
jgi:hypothetical protein